MNAAAIQRLNAINRTFYATTATAFDRTRQHAWPGWNRLTSYLPADDSALSVLDVGCGNGRFGLFLAETFPQRRLHYHGMDNNPALLNFARAALADSPHLTATLTERDIVLNPPDSGAYDLVVLFGMLHHVPGAANRRRLLVQLADRVAPGGLLSFASWCFAEYDRFQERFTPWPDDLDRERGDYLLDWRSGERALRYCHYVNDDEQTALVAATGLTHTLTYRADGADNAMNRYSLLHKSMP